MIGVTNRPRPASVPETTGLGIPFTDALRVWARIALLSFGGPAGQIAMMHRMLIEERRWIDEARFLHALNFCMLLPGPEAQQLAIYLGWLLHRTRGGIAAGILFVLPGMLTLMALSWISVLWGQVGPVAGVFFGLKAAVLAVVVEAILRVGRRALTSPMTILVAIAAFIALFVFAVPFPAVMLTAAAIGLLKHRLGDRARNAVTRQPDDPSYQPTPRSATPALGRGIRLAAFWLTLWLGPVIGLTIALGPDNVFTRLAVFFSKTAVVTFGGAYAILAYVAQQAVEHFHWLQPGEMLAGLGMAETTPGPLIMVLQHVGFLAGYHDPGTLPPLLAGTLAGLLVTWVTFTPCFLWVFLGAPYVETLRDASGLGAALSAVTAAVVGVIANLALWFGLHVLFREARHWGPFGVTIDLPVPGSLDPAAVLLAALAAFCLFRLRIGVIPTLLACAVGGVVAQAVAG
ncbi:MAG: chromate efflux transporter [Azospirillaceae bacterium]|nr:chromate efflux transporter [Azospirillaceae bacterium]